MTAKDAMCVASPALAFEDAKIQFQRMIKTISRFGDLPALIFGDQMMKLCRLKIGDQINITFVSETGAIILTPLRDSHSSDAIKSTIERTMSDYAASLKKLA